MHVADGIWKLLFSKQKVNAKRWLACLFCEFALSSKTLPVFTRPLKVARGKQNLKFYELCPVIDLFDFWARKMCVCNVAYVWWPLPANLQIPPCRPRSGREHAFGWINEQCLPSWCCWWHVFRWSSTEPHEFQIQDMLRSLMGKSSMGSTMYPIWIIISHEGYYRGTHCSHEVVNELKLSYLVRIFILFMKSRCLAELSEQTISVEWIESLIYVNVLFDTIKLIYVELW